jgi:ribosomal protein S1
LSIKRARHKECFDKYVKACGVGSKVRGVVVKKIEYGAFIRLAPGVEGLAHIREIEAGAIDSWALGEEVELVVSSIHHELMRIGLTDMTAARNWGRP